MESIREQKIEALQMASEYLDKLIPSMEEVIGEIQGEQKEDTISYLMQIIDGFNFMIETYNATSDVIDTKKIVDDASLEAAVEKLSEGFKIKDYSSIAGILQDEIVPFLRAFCEAAKAVA